jgi:hydroxyacylglutathione hydrolase
MGLVEVGSDVLVATSAEFMLTTTTVVPAPDGRCLVIDPGVAVAELRALAPELRSRGLVPCVGFATHPHWDHVLWCRDFGEAPRYASRRAAEAARRDHEALVREVQQAAPGHDPELIGCPLRWAAGPEVIPWHGPEARLLVHDGHAPGHAAVFLPDSGVLVAGDMCSDVEIPLPDLRARDPLGTTEPGWSCSRRCRTCVGSCPVTGTSGTARSFAAGSKQIAATWLGWSRGSRSATPGSPQTGSGGSMTPN